MLDLAVLLTAHMHQALGVALFAVLMLLSFWLFRDADALHDVGRGTNRPYSFSRVQLWWWTFLILGTWTLSYALWTKLWPFNAECLALLGISLGTTAAARVIDDRVPVEQRVAANEPTSLGFFRDILSDGAGPSVHRFQCFMFNLAYGATFVLQSFTPPNRGAFPTVDAVTMTLLAASSGGYLVLKANEAPAVAEGTPPMKNQANAVPSGSRAQNDELIDAEEGVGAEA